MAGIESGVAKSILGLLNGLRSKIVPLVERVVADAASTSTEVTEDSAKTVLAELKAQLTKVETEIKRHAPSGL